MTVPLAIGMACASMALELFMGSKKWIGILRSLAGFFMTISGLVIIIYIVNRAIVNLKHGDDDSPFLILYMVFEGILVLAFCYILFLNIRSTVRKIKEHSS